MLLLVKEFSRMSKLLRLSLVTCLFVALTALNAFAQSTVSGAIGGNVTDPNGAVVPNATVTSRNIETNKEDTATTDSEGRFRIVNLQPGTYTVTVNASGFGAFNQERVVVEVGRITSLDASLALGQAVAGDVNITSEAPVINTSQQDFSTNVNQTSINELPINGRRWSNFALLTPGAVPDGAFGLISFRGVSGLLNNNTVDGGDNNQAFFSEERGRTRISYVISQSSIREFQVNTSNYSAEYGRAAGGVVNAVTKSGTNQFHGDAFYYQRNNKWGSRNPFSFQTLLLPGGGRQVVGLKPEDVRHQFGGSIGGPIVKDKLFFFFTYDQQKRNFPAVSAPSSLTFFDLSAANQTTLTQRGVTNAQRDAALAYLQGLTGVVPRRGDQYILLPKIDWTINDKHTFSATYNRMRWESPAGVQSQPVVNRGRASFGDDFVDVDTLNLRLTSTLSPTVLNELRGQWGRDFESQRSQPPGPGEPATGVGGRPPSASIGSFYTIGKPNFLERASYPDERRIQIADSVTLSFGKHTLKFGGDFNRVSDVLDNLFQEGGVYSYNNLVDFISDFAVPSGKRYTGFNQGFGPTKFEFATRDYNFFIQDDVRYSPRLTLNFGLRYEYEQLPDPQIPNTLSNRPGQAIGPQQTGEFPSDKNNFGPRFGFAYDLTGDGKTSVRGGYGIYYGRIINSTISNAITNTGAPGAQRQVFLRPGDAGSPIYPNVLSGPVGAASASDIVVFSPRMANPMIHQMDVVLEREIARNTAVSVSFLASFGRYLPTFVDTNLSFPTATTKFFEVTGTTGASTATGKSFTFPRYTARPDTRFGRITEIGSGVKSEYEAMVLQFNRRLTSGLQVQANYTWARSMDNGQVSQTFTTGDVPLDPNNYSYEEGPSNFDIPHRFVVSAVWNPTFKGAIGESAVGRAIFNGWTIAPIVSISSGRPYSAETSGSAGVSTGIFGSGTSFSRFPLFGRNSFRFPSTKNVDLRISRRFRFTETTNLEILAEAFNLFNRVNVTDLGRRMYSIETVSATNLVPGLTNGTSILRLDPTFGVPSEAGNTVFRERQVQFAVRFQF
jgi:Carboxypeptidase regulatory-like domain/TonB dependent receptor-like, beta-barrel